MSPLATFSAGVLRRFVYANQALSRVMDALLPRRLRQDGNRTFLDETVPAALKNGVRLYDVGGGSQPCITLSQKTERRIHLVGLDISAEELGAAPPGLYDEIIVADLSTFRGKGDADVVISQSTLEHVRDNRRAVDGLASIVRPGGMVYIFVPCRNAVYARLNRVLPQRLKERLLAAVAPGTEEHQGFPAFYDRCTPLQLSELMRQSGLEVVEMRYFWVSNYFSAFFPLHFAWRLWQAVAWLISGYEASETFIMICRKTKT